MRLIDADEFKNVLNSGGGEKANINISKSMPLGEIVDTVIQAYRKCLFAELEKMPTAHDIDKVVEQIKKATDKHGLVDYINGKQAISKEQAIQIVKAGGVNATD